MDNTSLPVKFSQRAISWLIISTLVWQPMAPAVAAAISPTGPASMDSAANGVPVLNIATPNGAGISHNQFNDYNVGKEGLILNNATGQLNQTQLGGIIQNNPNLRPGQEARGIINEVTGGSRSQLQGYTEVAGKAANVMVANPYGITCDGCGFINTPNATLTTGKPQFDDKGNLSALNVTGGTITVEGKGLDASQSDALSIIARATEVNAAIHAKDLTVTAGANRVGADGSVAAIEGEGTAPTVAVDTGALGGMYANRIHLVSSEKGVGVNLGNLNARQGDIQLDASGKLVLKDSLSSGALTVKAQNAELSGDNKAAGAATVTAQNEIALKQGSLVSDKTVSLDAGDRVDIASGKVTAGENIRLTGTGLGIDKASTADAAGAIDLNAQGNDLNNAGQLTAGQAISLNAGTVSNSGTLAAKGRLDATGKRVDNQGTLQGNGVTLKSETLSNSGTLQSAGALDLSGRSLAQTGTLGAGGDAALRFDDSIHNSGSVLVDGGLTATTGELVQNGTLSGRKGIAANSDTLSSGKGAQTTSEGDVALNAGRSADIAGEINAGGLLALNSEALNTDDTARLQGQTVDLKAANAKLNGTQAAKQTLNVSADTLTHGGKSSAERIHLNAGDTLNNGGTLSATDLALESGDIINSGLLQGTGSLSLLGNRLDNRASGSIHTLGDFALNLPDFTNSGLLSAGGQLQLSGNRLSNSGEINAASLTSDYGRVDNLAGGRLLATDGMRLTQARLDNGGQIVAGQLDLDADTLTNLSDGELLSDGQLTLTGGELINEGLLQAGQLNLTADNWRNDGVALSAQDATAQVKGSLTNNGKILGQQGLDITVAATDNAGQVVAKVLALHGDLVNSGLLQGDDRLALDGRELKNNVGGQMLSAGNTTLDAGMLDNRGELQANTLDVTANDWNNRGTARAGDGLTANLSGEMQNSGLLRSAQTLDLHAADIVNEGILAADRLSLSAPQLKNSGILQGTSGLTLKTDKLNNLSGGELLSGKGLSLTLDTLQNDGLLHVGETFDLKARQLNNGGSLQADRLALDIRDTLSNDAGAELLGTEDATLKAKHLDNTGTLAAKSLSVSGDTLTNRGTLQGDSTFSATFGDLANQTGGNVISGGKMTVTGDDVRNDGQWQAQQLELNADSLTNRGDINGIAGVTATLLGKLENSGSLRSQGTTHLQANSLLNSGRLMADDLTIEAERLQNLGLLQGNRTLNARGNTITQSADGRTLTSGTLALTAGQLTTDGKLQGQQVILDADDWQHKGSLVGGSSLMATVANQLVNDGELMNQGDMQLNAAELDNRGTVLSSGDITLGGDRLKNSGSVQGLTLALSQGQVNNSGKLIGIDALTVAAPAVAGRLALAVMAKPERELRNEQGGEMLTKGDLTLHSDNVTNNGSWQGQNILLNAQRLNNGGDIQSAGDMQLVLDDSLTSAEGSKIVANGTAALQALTLTNQGEWIAKNLTLKATNLTNGGAVSGVNDLTLDLSDGLTQQQGSTLQSGGSLALNVTDLDNQGRIQADTLAITGNALTNSGSLQGDNGLKLTMRDSLTNTASGSLLSGKGVTLIAPELINYGLIQGGDASTLMATDSVRNDGKILNDGALTVTAPTLANNGMLQATDLILDAANIGNNGTLLGSDALNVTAQQINLQSAGKLLSGGNLMLSSNGFDQLGQVVALGDATLKLVNSFSGRGTLAAGKKLNVSSNGELTNHGIMQGDALDLSADGALINNGTLTSGNGASTLTGDRIDIGSTGSLQGGGDINLVSRGDITLNGFTGTGGTLTLSAPGTIVNTALLYAANNLWLLADSIKNQGGNILAGDSLWMQRDKAGAANSEILNTSGTIETTNGDITLKTGHLLNQWESITQGESKTENLATGYKSYSPGTVELPLSIFTPEEIHYRTLEFHHGALGQGAAYVSEPFPKNVEMVKEAAISRITSTTEVTGSAGRIAAGGNLYGLTTSLDNLGSSILAGKSLSLTGERLNNQSWLSGTQTVWRKYTAAPYYKSNNAPDSTFEVSYGWPFTSTATNSLYGDTLTFIATDEYRTEGSSSLRGVIQSNGDVTTRFGTVVNNSESTEVRGTIAPTLTRPGLQTLVQLTLSGETDGAEPTEFKPIAVNSPEWRDQLQNALQQVNGGSTLDLPDGRTVNLADYPQGSIKYAADGTVTVLDDNPWRQNQQISGLQAKPLDTSAYPLPQGDNGYFAVSDKPDSPYLIAINPKLNGLGALDKNVYGDLYQLLNMQPDAVPAETRQQYTDQNAFLGSSYFLDRLNLKPEYDYRILGDAAFDTRYVSNAVLSQTGNRYINGMGSDLEQMKYLMDNAAAAQQSLGLQAGVTLTADQIASLDRSMLWWEAATINGQTVLVPKLYLASGDVAVNNGSIIAGNNVTIEGDSVSNNGSTLLAKQGMTIDSQTGIDNRNASLIKAGEGLQLSAVSDINNVGSAISGKQVALESLEGDINNLTLTTQTRNDSRWNRSLFIEQDEKATIDALDSLSLNAGKNISVAGAALSAGGDTVLKAGSNIDILANNNATLFDTAWQHYKSGSSAASTLESGGKLDITAGDDLTIQASNVDVAKGAELTAGNDLSLNAGQTAKNSYSSYDRSYSSSADRSSISAGDNLILTAGRDLTSQAASLKAGELAGLQAGRDVNLLAEATTWGDSYWGGLSKAVNDHVRQQGTEITSGGDTVIVAGHDVKSQATQVLAEKDVGIAAQNDISLLTATESDYSFEDKTKIKSGFLSKKTTRTVEEHSSTNELSTLLSGDNVSLQAGNDLLIRGSAVAADGDIALKGGGDVTIEAATERASDYSMKKTTKSGFFGNGLGFTIGSQSAQETRKGAQVTQSDSRSVIGTTAGNIIVEAGDKATLVAANMVAGRDTEDTTRKTGHIDVKANDIDIVAGKDVVTGSVEQKTKSSGFGVSISNPVMETVRNIRDIAKTSGGSNITQAKTIAGEGAASAFDILDGAMKIAMPFTYGQSSSKSEMHYAGEYAVGSTLSSGGNVQLTATGSKGNGDVLINGSNIGAKEAAIIDAQRNVDITASTDKQVSSSESSSKNWSVTTAMPTIGSAIRTVSGGPNNGSSILPFGYGKSNSKEYNETTAQTGSQITAEDVYINSKDGHVNVSGSSLAAINDLMLTAKNGEITVDTGNNHVVKETSGSQTQIGSLGGDGYSGTVGWSRDKYASQLDQNQQSTLRSQIASRDGDVTLAAGKDVAIDGADISAGKSVNISGENVRFDISEDTLKSHSESSNTQYGVKASASGWVVSAAQAVENAARSVEENRDPRLSAIYAAQAGLNIASQTMQSDMNPSAVKVTVSATAGSSKQEQDFSSQQQQGTTIKAGESVNISAEKDITGAGVNIAGKNVSLDAGRDIILATAQDKEALKNSSSGNQFSVGVGFNLVGQQNGFSIELGASTYSNKENGDGLVHHNSQIVADETLTVNSGRDTTLKGTELKGDKVAVDVGRNLTIASLQDEQNYESKNKSGGVNVSICVPPICAGSSVSGTANASGGKITNEYKSVIDQSGIFAGQGGFDVHVGEHTQLDGAVIASDATADKNRLDTGTLGWTDIENKAKSGGSQYAVSVSGGVQQQEDGSLKPIASGLPTASLASVSDSDSSTTRSAVADGEIVIRDKDKQQQDIADLSRDTENAHQALENNFDKDKIRDQLETQTQAVALGTQAMDAWRTSKQEEEKAKIRAEMEANGELKGLSDEQINAKIEKSEQYKKVDEKYGVGSEFWRNGTALTGLLAGVLGGNVSSGMAAGAAPYVAGLIKDVADGHPAARIALHTLASAVLVKAQGGNSAAGAAGGFIAASSAEALAQAFYDKSADKLSPDEKMVISNLVTALGAVGGSVAGGSSQGIGSGANAARVEVENNSLKGDEAREAVKQSAEWWKEQVRDKLGKNLASQLANGLINVASETGDMAMLGGDTAFDLMAALVTCATGDGYCSQARSDLAKKDAATASMLNAIISGDAWEGIKASAINAANGDQRALESVAGVLAGVLIPAKGLPGGKTTSSVTDGIASTEKMTPETPPLTWKAGEGEFSYKPDGTVTNVEHIDGKFNGNSIPYDKPILKQEYVDILSPEMKQHILYGDKPGSGGHQFPGRPGKTAFPNNWSAEKIINDVGDIATSPDTQWFAQTGTGGIYTSKGKPANWVSYEVRDGVRVRVVFQPATGKVVTAFPDNASVPAAYKPIKK
ncbi:filamentous hemagglutinin [Enterobacter sp. BIGb0383]|uniref:hemagglutinin repeat-containing protein n=1 Tax=unclassified Enterobacter TaxID=2608935 RepID=UPI000F46BC7B|nr:MULTISPECIES: hemagglutinin repeat-containing protein [unclassified Enterobacter]ROP48904.1 filamentous hemagglutinin [Enterobacter sp. BIGb0383]ROS00504.1 filamentous hemagglutinin [Enterobacter sp. BIGb0359]